MDDDAPKDKGAMGANIITFPAAGKADASHGLPVIDPAAWANSDPPPRRWALDGFIPAAQTTLLTGAGGEGKSLAGQQLATCIAAGLPFLRQHARPGVALYVTAEDEPAELHRRQHAICRALGIGMAALSGQLHLVSLRGLIGNELALFDHGGRMTPAERFSQLERLVQQTGATFIVLDNAAHLFAGDENNRGQVTAFVGLLDGLAMKADAAVLLMAHPNKAGQEYSGSTAWENAVRSRLFMQVPDRDEQGVPLDSDARILTVSKANYGRKDAKVRFRWCDWAFVHQDDLSPDENAAIVAGSRDAADDVAFLRCLDAATEQQRATSHIKGTNYAPAMFADMPDGKGIGPARFAAAMERLLSRSVILCDQPLWRGQNRHLKHGLARAGNCADPPAPTPRADPAPTPGQVPDNAAPTLRAPTPPYTTYKPGGPPPDGGPTGHGQEEGK